MRRNYVNMGILKDFLEYRRAKKAGPDLNKASSEIIQQWNTLAAWLGISDVEDEACAPHAEKSSAAISRIAAADAILFMKNSSRKIQTCIAKTYVSR